MKVSQKEILSLFKLKQYGDIIEKLSCLEPDPVSVNGPIAIGNLFRKKWGSTKQECFFVAALDGAHKLISAEMITKGLINRTVVHPREVFRFAILHNSAAIIVGHNHPSGQTNPSEEDKKITERLVNAGEVIGINVLDHIIVSQKTWVSFCELGIMPNGD